ncbi:pyridoxamine 5'-phosphate oxidase family protein [Ilumatobacter sp.]|uniref:pyridoxamine 5'-phosphate oxidase family protein n=1 Tax=Ilumatobacter sp. TaxID=1967498 RepID=UPI003B51AD4E
MSDSSPRPLSDLLEGGTTLMVATREPDGTVGSRPLTVAEVDGDTISMLIDSTADWAMHLSDGDWVLATLSDTRDNDYATMTGRLTTTSDPATIDRLWSPFAGAYFDEGRESPEILVLRIGVDEGSYWDSPSGRIGSLISLVRAKVGDGEDAGDHGELSV